ncbi:hypothetical protein [Leptolyngbya sp. FACHB-16]|uniref:hypothetical protein n=1 Tax=unclassified Leptolyngbya TaxID=2650499 RepID=UPI001681C523|nr:hypothetical protein [Leptolyngbya sp. FACHB-16]MBD2156033.1 hypothetical protein [Leptolyngbya sp. FACHB-16]
MGTKYPGNQTNYSIRVKPEARAKLATVAKRKGIKPRTLARQIIEAWAAQEQIESENAA